MGVVEVVNVFNWHTVAAFRVTGNVGQIISNLVESAIYGIVDHKDLISHLKSFSSWV